MSRSDPDAMQRAREAYLRNPAAGFETDCEPRIRELEAEVERLRGALTRTAANLAAAISLLERGGKAAKKAAASDKMFDIMLNDYREALEGARAALAGEGDYRG